MTAQLSPLGVQKFYDNNGNPLAFGLLYTYAAGTTTPQATYVDSTQTTQNTNPIQLNFRGECNLWLDPTLTYKFLLTDASGNTIPNWPVDNVPGGQLGGFLSLNLIPNPTNTYTLGSLTRSWANLYVGANNAPVLDTVSGNIGYYARTAAEIAATVTPSNFSYPELTHERYGGGTAASAGTNNSALANAISVATSRGGGTIQFLSAGTYTFSNTFVLPPYTRLQGQGYGTVVSYTGSGSFITLNSTSSRASIGQMILQGTNQTGTGITLGDNTGASGQNVGFALLDRVLVTGFNVGMRMGGATWLTCNKCEFGNAAGITGGTITKTNNIGVDFNFFGTGNYSSALTFIDCVVSNNFTQGVKATNVPVNMNNIVWINCTVQNNCQGTPANPQFEMNLVAGFVIDNIYMEYLGSGTVPDAIRADNFSYGQIRAPFIAQASAGITDRTSGLVSKVEILGAQISATGNAINLPSEHDVIVRGGTFTGSVVLSGTGCSYLPAGSGLAAWPVDENSFPSAPVLTPATGSITQTATHKYSQVGHVLTFEFRINWTALSTPTGSLTVTNLPVAPLGSGPDFACAVGYASGITIAAGYLGFFVAAGTTTGTLYNVQTTTAAVQASALAASGSLIISGSYQV